MSKEDYKPIIKTIVIVIAVVLLAQITITVLALQLKVSNEFPAVWKHKKPVAVHLTYV